MAPVGEDVRWFTFSFGILRRVYAFILGGSEWINGFVQDCSLERTAAVGIDRFDTLIDPGSRAFPELHGVCVIPQILF